MNTKLKAMMMNASVAGSVGALAFTVGAALHTGAAAAADELMGSGAESTVMLASSEARGDRSGAEGAQRSGTIQRANLLVGEQVVDRFMSMGVSW